MQKFNEDAEKYSDGSIEQLITCYLNSHDPIFRDGGASIKSNYDRYNLLNTKLAVFKKNQWAAYTQVLLTPVKDIRAKVLNEFTYAITLAPASLVFGLVIALLITLSIESIVRFFILLGHKLTARVQFSSARIDRL